ncbi:MAG: hypothetical protein AYP45_18375 [Candidatus Brocadia carolinensis]|uniref:Uncharacterized protein n=1 Tax=Candidatus Brocadia carolinensis TaxID=1004156 RepID=A0A1V4ANY8_9BACT|nr:MAG: hypothetical protein AYP45_18375 [Candidatus Brocadia caroliniensis]
MNSGYQQGRIFLIAIVPEFSLQYAALPKAIKKKFTRQLTHLKDNPKHNSLRIHKLKSRDFWDFCVT